MTEIPPTFSVLRAALPAPQVSGTAGGRDGALTSALISDEPGNQESNERGGRLPSANDDLEFLKLLSALASLQSGSLNRLVPHAPTEIPHHRRNATVIPLPSANGDWPSDGPISKEQNTGKM